MAVHLTAKEAARLGIDASKGRTGRAELEGSPARSRTWLAYHTRCSTCREEFTVEAAEERHMADSGHHRYELVIERSQECDQPPTASSAAPPFAG